MFDLKNLFRKPESNLEEVVFNKSPQTNNRIYISVSALALLIFLAIALDLPLKDVFLKGFFPKPSSRAATGFRISGNVFLDTNINGLRECGVDGVCNTSDDQEVGAKYVPISITGASSSATFTDKDGDYSFSNLPAGNYTVSLALSTGFSVTSGTKTPTVHVTLDSDTVINFGTLFTPPGIADSACTVQSISPYDRLTSNFTPTILSGEYTVLNGTEISVITSSEAPPITPVPSWSGVNQLYTRRETTQTCLGCNTPSLGSSQPDQDRYKVHPIFRPQQDFIITLVEAPQDASCAAPNCPTINKNTAATVLIQEENSGYWTNIYATTLDGSQWYQLTGYTMSAPSSDNPSPIFGVLAPRISPDGNKLAWSEIYRSPDSLHPFGFWKLYVADFIVTNGVPTLTNIRDFTPVNSTISEVHDWLLDNTTVIFSTDSNMSSPYGWDEYSLNITTGQLTDLNNSPDQWDEQVRISPSGKKLAWVSTASSPSLIPKLGNLAYDQFLPQMSDEYYIMDTNGNNMQQITHFNAPAPAGIPNPEYIYKVGSIAQAPTWSADGKQLKVSQDISFNNQSITGSNTWLITFAGSCGGNSVSKTLTPTPTGVPTPIATTQ